MESASLFAMKLARTIMGGNDIVGMIWNRDAEIRQECVDRAADWYCKGDPSIENPRLTMEDVLPSLRAAIEGRPA